MTVFSVVTVTAYDLAGGSGLGPFATVWPFEDVSDVRVWIYTDTDQPARLTLGADFAVSAPSPLETGGNVTLAAAVRATYSLAAAGRWDPGVKVVLDRRTSVDQPAALGDMQVFAPSVYEGSEDHIARVTQDLDSARIRGLRVPVGDVVADLPPAALRANLILSFNASGEPVCELGVGAGQIEIPGPRGAQGPAGAKGDPGAGSLGYTPLNKAGDTATNLLIDEASAPVANSAGYRGAPVTTHNADYVLAATDDGRTILAGSGGPYVWTVPPQSTAALPKGSVVVFRSRAAAAITLKRGAGVTLRLAGQATSQDVTLSQWGMATLLMEDNDVWVASGTNIG